MTRFTVTLRLSAAILGLTIGAAEAGALGQTLGYTCDRGTTAYATFIGSEADSAIVLMAEGQQVGLMQQISASGAKYAPAEGVEGYAFWIKGDEALLYWQGKTEADDLNLANCSVTK